MKLHTQMKEKLKNANLISLIYFVSTEEVGTQQKLEYLWRYATLKYAQAPLQPHALWLIFLQISNLHLK